MNPKRLRALRLRALRLRALRRTLSLRYTAPILAALIFVAGQVFVRRAPVEGLESGLMSMVPAGALHTLGRMRRPYGMPPRMFNSFVIACEESGVSPMRVLQTIGNATASAGAHWKDGEVSEEGSIYDYCAAVDLRSSDITEAQRRKLLNNLFEHGFAGWYRNRGSFANNRHFHVVYARYWMKPMLRAQVRDFLHGLDALKGHRRETFLQPTTAQTNLIRAQFLKANPTKGSAR